jgi:hypothetical protein
MMAKRKIREKCDKLGKFYVNFYYGDDDELDAIMENNPDGEDEYNEAHAYHNEIALNCSEEEYYRCLDEHEDEIRQMEAQYGILDGEGMDNDMGYSSYEISLANAPIVWEKLVNMLRNANLLAE